MGWKHNDRIVAAVRDAVEGDPDFEVGAEQVVVTLEDGTNETVKRSEVVPEPGSEGE